MAVQPRSRDSGSRLQGPFHLDVCAQDPEHVLPSAARCREAGRLRGSRKQREEREMWQLGSDEQHGNHDDRAGRAVPASGHLPAFSGLQGAVQKKRSTAQHAMARKPENDEQGLGKVLAFRKYRTPFLSRPGPLRWSVQAAHTNSSSHRTAMCEAHTHIQDESTGLISHHFLALISLFGQLCFRLFIQDLAGPLTEEPGRKSPSVEDLFRWLASDPLRLCGLPSFPTLLVIEVHADNEQRLASEGDGPNDHPRRGQRLLKAGRLTKASIRSCSTFETLPLYRIKSWFRGSVAAMMNGR